MQKCEIYSRYTAASVRVRLTYHRPQELVTDADGQFSKGGVLARVTVPLEVGARFPCKSLLRVGRRR